MLPVTLFILEYQKKKHKLIQELQEQTASRNPSDQHIHVKVPVSQILPFVIGQVATNPIIWSMIIGVIFNFTIDVGDYPVFFDTTVRYIVNSVYAVAMFTMGLFLFDSSSSPSSLSLLSLPSSSSSLTVHMLMA